MLDGVNQGFYGVSLLGFADYPGDRQILTDLDGLKVQFLGYKGPGYIFTPPIVLQLPDGMQIGGQPAYRWSGAYFLFYHGYPLVLR
jgi:hypothetical protein